MKKQYEIPEGRFEGLQAQIEKLNKRAAKLGVSPIVLRKLDAFRDVPVYKEGSNEVKYVVRWISIEVEGDAPKYAGWSLVAVVEHAEEGNILRKVPGCEVELAQFRSGAPRCDHCHTVRNRRDTYVVGHEDGSFKVIGSNCIKDFLGHKDPHQLAQWAEIWFSVSEFCEDVDDAKEYNGGAGRERLPVSRMLSYSACAIRKLGYISGKREYESQGAVSSTRSTARHWMNPSPKMVEGRDYFLPEPQDEENGEKARQFVIEALSTKPEDKLSDFEHNLLMVCKCESVDFPNSGIIAYVPEYYAREMGKKVERERQEAAIGKRLDEFFGEVGKRMKGVDCVYIRSTGWDSQYGHTFLHTFAGPNGERLFWKTGTELAFDVAQKVNLTFTVKAHDTYEGKKQTKITRVVAS